MGRPSADATLADLLVAAAEARPDGVALVGLDGPVRWSDVERRTRALAATLRARGLETGDRVAIARRKTHRSFEAVHGVLRAGGVVVPIDPQAPPSLARTVMADSGARAVIGDVATIGPLDPWSIPSLDNGPIVICDEVDWTSNPATTWETATDGDPDLDRRIVGPDDDSYVIYTSGSTGRPKGIVHTHASAMAYAHRAVVEYGLSPDDRLAGMNPLHFDMSTLELYAAPLAGATVVVMAEPHLQFAAALTERSAATDVTIWYTVPFLLRNVTERGGLDRRPLPHLRSVLWGGEPYPGAALRELMQLLPGVRFVNVYGPAEVNACLHHHVHDPADVGDQVPIGRPWDGVDVRVVDGGLDVATGEAGELWVSAPTAMRGYAGLTSLTAERLVPREAGGNWYTTGDLVHRDADDVYWFHGRLDHQVKVRGVRIELEAIEHVLTDAPNVLHAVAGPLGPAGEATFIGAELVLRAGATEDDEGLRTWCAERLPSVAVPRTFSYRTDLPMTPSGKIDRRAVRLRMIDAQRPVEAPG
ncbi:MAG: AMP-binding protein [Ilumatobacter sp.]|nr:AMP-binding protein [Ilumatobacter sp.]